MILLLAGTQDGRELAAYLQQNGMKVVVSVVSQYGKQLAEAQHLVAAAGELTAAGFADRIRTERIHLVVDATHPYAVNVSKNAMEACEKTGIDYLRYEREVSCFSVYERLYRVTDYAEAAECAARLGKTIFLTTGSRNLAQFVTVPCMENHKLIVRVLPEAGVLAECSRLGVTPEQIVAMQGPFSHELNVALFKAFKADVIISKNSGRIGGTDTKFTAARELKLPFVLIERPAMDYKLLVHTKEEVLCWIKQTSFRWGNPI